MVVVSKASYFNRFFFFFFLVADSRPPLFLVSCIKINVISTDGVQQCLLGQTCMGIQEKQEDRGLGNYTWQESRGPYKLNRSVNESLNE